MKNTTMAAVTIFDVSPMPKNRMKIGAIAIFGMALKNVRNGPNTF